MTNTVPNKRSKLIIAAGLIYLFIALLHTIGGQLELVNPMLDSRLDKQVKTELLGAWHLVTAMLWIFGFMLVKSGIKLSLTDRSMLQLIAIVTLAFVVIFIGVSLAQWTHALQYILFLPPATMIFMGLKKSFSTT